MQLGETKYSFTILSKGEIDIIELFVHSVIHWLVISLDQYFRTKLPDFFGCAL
jgi:hypothetical protein